MMGDCSVMSVPLHSPPDSARGSWKRQSLDLELLDIYLSQMKIQQVSSGGTQMRGTGQTWGKIDRHVLLCCVWDWIKVVKSSCPRPSIALQCRIVAYNTDHHLKVVK